MSYLSDAKTRLRITSTAYDDEIDDLISAAMDDMGLVGVTPESVGSSSALVKQAIMTYVKANFGWDNPDRDRLMESYESMRNQLSLTQEHGYFAITFAITSGGIAVREAIVTFDGETLETGSSGVATFYRRAGNNYPYTVSAEGYAPDIDDANLVDVIDTSVTVAVSLVVS